MSNRDGGPAYPIDNGFDANGNLILEANPGMTMRQYYKAAALTGLLANGLDEATADQTVNMAGLIANAMLAEDEAREREGVGVPARDYETEQRLSAIYQAVDDGKLEEAHTLAETLRADIGDFPDLQEAIALLDRFALLRSE